MRQASKGHGRTGTETAMPPEGRRKGPGRFLSALVIGVLMVALAACAAQRPVRSARGGIGKPPPERAPVEYTQSRSGPLITPDTDPFAID
ncbi:hypothetical protein FHS82_000677 [Pseudochelatococcus lubricantis]|uniref:Uncharacterized protein n=1 Tax=Pseudochelatococcus lubricantis TaxID=1538102 RepID=A0ABX0UX60_9HYPH|nr:hypothetical protein [Pseudochelatococcus lubricantis]